MALRTLSSACFHAIKTGYRFQERQLEDYEGLVNPAAIFALMAYHLLSGQRLRRPVMPRASLPQLLTLSGKQRR